jgi:hypothetical protein
MKPVVVSLGIVVVLSSGCTFNITFNITGTVPARAGSGSQLAEDGTLHVYPPELQAGDIVTDEHGDQWELMSVATKVAGTLEFARPCDASTAQQTARQRRGNSGGGHTNGSRFDDPWPETHRQINDRRSDASGRG